MKKILNTVYIYGIPFYLTALSLMFYFIDIDCTKFLRETWASWAVAFFCWREYYMSIRLRKCKWQKISIIGVLIYCIIDISFYNNYGHWKGEEWVWNSYYRNSEFIVFVFAIIATIYFMIREKDPICD